MTYEEAKTKKKVIAGHELELEEGQRYLASRPIADRFCKVFPVRIQRLTGTAQGLLARDYEIVLEGFTYDEANAFLGAFNNGVTSFEGRVW